MNRRAATCAAYWQIKLKHLERGNVVEQRFSPDNNVEKVVLYKEEYEYLYRDGDMFVLMHPKTYEQISLPVAMIPQEQHGFMVPNMHLSLLSIETKVVQAELPQIVEVDVIDAPEAARGDTATSVTKLATIETAPRFACRDIFARATRSRCESRTASSRDERKVFPRRGVRYSDPCGLRVTPDPRGSEYLTPRLEIRHE